MMSNGKSFAISTLRETDAQEWTRTLGETYENEMGMLASGMPAKLEVHSVNVGPGRCHEQSDQLIADGPRRAASRREAIMAIIARMDRRDRRWRGWHQVRSGSKPRM